MVAPIVGAAAAAAAKAIAKKVATDAAKKAAVKQAAEALKKSGLAKLAKINRTTSESDILYARAHGKISSQEAAAINPKLFPLPDKTRTSVIGTINPKTGKVTRGK